MALHETDHDLVGSGLAEIKGGRRRHGARICGEQVAPGGQHVGAATRRRARRPCGDVAAVERGQQGGFFIDRALQAQCVGLAIRRAAIDMQAVLDREILDVAQPGVDATQRFIWRVGPGDAGFRGKAGLGGSLHDQLRQPVATAAVEPIGLRIFVDQPLQFLLAFVQARAGQRRRQMAEGDGGDAALGLCGLARIGDDERIDDRQRASDDLGEAILPKRHRLAGQPFQRSMGADMDDRLHAERLLQPQAESDQFVARRQRRVMIVGAPVRRAATIRRQRHGDVAEGGRTEGEAGRCRRLAQASTTIRRASSGRCSDSIA